MNFTVPLLSYFLAVVVSEPLPEPLADPDALLDVVLDSAGALMVVVGLFTVSEGFAVAVPVPPLFPLLSLLQAVSVKSIAADTMPIAIFLIILDLLSEQCEIISK